VFIWAMIGFLVLAETALVCFAVVETARIRARDRRTDLSRLP